MAIILSDYAKGQRATLTAERAGATVTQELTVTVKAGSTQLAADIVELGALPAFHDLSDIRVVHDAMGAGVTMKLGFLTGEFGSTEQTRTLGSDFGSATDVATAGSKSIIPANAVRLPAVGYHRGIGIQFSGPVTAGGTDLKLTVILVYQPPSN